MLPNLIIRLLKNHASPSLVLAIDLVMVGVAYLLAYLIRFELSFNIDFTDLASQAVFMVVLGLLSYILLGSYKGIIRETSVKDAVKVLNANILLLAIALALAGYLNTLLDMGVFHIPVSVLIIHFLILTVMMVVSRFVFKYLFSSLKTTRDNLKNTLIYGAGDSGIVTLQAILNDAQAPYKVVGFLDDDTGKTKKRINQLPIYDGTRITQSFLEDLAVEVIIVSIQNISHKQLMVLTDRLLELKVKVNIVPSINTWLSGTLQANQIKPLEIEDLLNREPITLENPEISDAVKDHSVMITGAGGSIGSELVRQISQYDYRHLVLVDIAESALYDVEQELIRRGKARVTARVADVCDAASMALLFEAYRPYLVIHAAAYKHVPLMEQNPYRAIKTNILGTKVLADLALQYHTASFLMVSTDKAVNPTNIMGATKRAAEVYLTALSEQHPAMKVTITRFGNVLGSNGSVIPLFKQQMKHGGPLTVTHNDIIRYFMTIKEACSLILEANTMGKGGEIFVFDMGDPVRIFDLAKRMIELSGLRYPEDVDIVITGLRPGEKLYEELLADKEATLPTYHPKILIAKTETLQSAAVIASINTMVQVNSAAHPEQSVRALKALLPGYKSQNSVWEAYDDVPLQSLKKD
jgi:FlaA1/EpsC-like NDP-sugar epimerase